jgi:hypothetical protein
MTFFGGEVKMSATCCKILQHVKEPTKDNGFLRAIKVSSMTSFGGEVKMSAPCHKILQHVKDPFNISLLHY